MSESRAKTIRRDLRRAVGIEAANVIDAQTSLLQHQIRPSITALQVMLGETIDRCTAIEKQAAVLDKRVTFISTSLTAALGKLHAFQSRSFVDRLRWVITGQ